MIDTYYRRLRYLTALVLGGIDIAVIPGVEESFFVGGGSLFRRLSFHHQTVRRVGNPCVMDGFSMLLISCVPRSNAQT